MWHVWRTGEVHLVFCWGDAWKSGHLEDLGADGMRILIEVGWGVMDWIYLSEDRYSWRAVVTAVMNLRFP